MITIDAVIEQTVITFIALVFAIGFWNLTTHISSKVLKQPDGGQDGNTRIK